MKGGGGAGCIVPKAELIGPLLGGSLV